MADYAGPTVVAAGTEVFPPSPPEVLRAAIRVTEDTPTAAVYSDDDGYRESPTASVADDGGSRAGSCAPPATASAAAAPAPLESRSRSTSFTSGGAAGFVARLRSLSFGPSSASSGRTTSAGTAADLSAPTDMSRSPSSISIGSSLPVGDGSPAPRPEGPGGGGAGMGVRHVSAGADGVVAWHTVDAQRGGAPATATDTRRTFWSRWLQQQLQQPAPTPLPAGPAPAGELLDATDPAVASANAKAAAELQFWAEVLQGDEAALKRRAKQVAEHVRAGIPHIIRGLVWQRLSNSKDPQLEERYRHYLKESSEWDRDIVRDIDRTYPNQELFKEKQQALFNVLKAYALHDSEIGYCQGQAFVAGLLLMHMPEEEAFATLVHWMEDFRLRALYKEGMEGLYVRMYQLNALLQDHLPRLHRHLEECGVQCMTFASQWFMALFATDFPLPVVLRIVDIMLVEGADVLLRFALALLGSNEDVLLELRFEGLLDYLKRRLYNETAFPTVDDFVAEALRYKVPERRLQKLELHARAHFEDMTREKVELVQLRTERREAELRARTAEAKLADAQAECARIGADLARTKTDYASALERIEDMDGRCMGEQERALRQFQRMLLAEPDERLAEIGRLANEVRELRQQNRDLAAELVDAKLRYADSQTQLEQLAHQLDVERRRRPVSALSALSSALSTSTPPDSSPLLSAAPSMVPPASHGSSEASTPAPVAVAAGVAQE